MRKYLEISERDKNEECRMTLVDGSKSLYFIKGFKVITTCSLFCPQEKVWSEYEVACAQTPRCLELRGVHHTRCVRQCVSPSCYLDIYTHDEVSW